MWSCKLLDEWREYARAGDFANILLGVFPSAIVGVGTIDTGGSL